MGNVFLNGRILAEEAALVSVLDRGWMYGDGLFETLRVSNGRPFQWRSHWERLSRGLEELRLKSPYPEGELRQATLELSRLNQLPEGVLRVAVSRGVGPRGYSPKGAENPTWVMTLGAFLNGRRPELPVRWRAVTSRRVQIHSGPLSKLKTANRLPQILARLEADDAGVEEAIICDLVGNVAEAASGNQFWMLDGVLHTPPIALGGLPGIARATV